MTYMYKILCFATGMSVYTVVIVSFTGVPVQFFVSNPNANFVLLSIFILFPTTLTLCLVFIPKVRLMEG